MAAFWSSAMRCSSAWRAGSRRLVTTSGMLFQDMGKNQNQPISTAEPIVPSTASLNERNVQQLNKEVEETKTTAKNKKGYGLASDGAQLLAGVGGEGVAAAVAGLADLFQRSAELRRRVLLQLPPLAFQLRLATAHHCVKTDRRQSKSFPSIRFEQYE